MNQKTKTRQQIANEYGVTYKTLKSWFKKYNLDVPKGLILPRDQELIYKTLGNPNNSDSA